MSVAAVLFPVADLIVRAADKTPKDEDVKAGWTAFALFLLLIGAVVVLAVGLFTGFRELGPIACLTVIIPGIVLLVATPFFGPMPRAPETSR